MFFSKEKKEMMATMQECLLGVQENNRSLATALTQLMENKKDEPQAENIDPWRAVYALNLCTVSVSQIVETNDMRFMEQEYENILNNLNLEMMPKDEALLDILKQILDVINFFKIQAKEKELLEKEYQQKIKDAIWSAVPNPSVILAGGKAGWLGLAVSAAVTVGTSYMNYRKAKANVNSEQERKKWELERSAMEQLHGLQRQLFETAWRLADKYKFDDKDRLTERQIKQFIAILVDDDYMRRYNRLEYIQDKFNAYPPFWYHMGSAALRAAHQENDVLICRDWLQKARYCFNEFFKRTQKEKRLLREDPVVAQCAFEYLAVMNQLQAKSWLAEGEYERNDLISKLDTTVESSGNALDVLQQCALNYIALDQRDEAIRIMKALVNEQYNVHSNVQLLSLLYVEEYLSGHTAIRAEYEMLKREYEDSTYPLVEEISQQENADKVFLQRQKQVLAKRVAQSCDSYLAKVRYEFDEILSRDYDITEDVVRFFYKVANDFSELFASAHQGIAASIKKSLKDKQDDDFLYNCFRTREKRNALTLDAFLQDFIREEVAKLVFRIGTTQTMQDLSALESKVFAFCEKQNILLQHHKEEAQNTANRQSIESVLLGSDFATYKEAKSLLDKFLKVVSDPQYKNKIIEDTREVEFIVLGDPRMDLYKAENHTKLQGVYGDIFAIIWDQKSSWGVKRDLVLATTGVYVVGKRGTKSECSYGYVSASGNNKALVVIQAGGKGQEIYDQPGVDYICLNELLSKLKTVEQSESKPVQAIHRVGAINVKWLVETEMMNWQRLVE